MEPMRNPKGRPWRATIRALVLLALVAPGPGIGTAAEPAWKERTTERWEEEIRRFEEGDRNRPPPTNAVLFVGSSSIRLWRSLEGDFPRHQVVNRGFGGSMLIDSIYFADRIITPYRPRMVVVYAGTNDINDGKTPLEVEGDFRALTAKIHAALPRTRIAYISVAANPKRWPQRAAIREANRRIAAFCEGDERLAFVDAFGAMLGPDGQPRPEIFVEDRLHMNEKGYALWRDLVAPLLPEPDR